MMPSRLGARRAVTAPASGSASSALYTAVHRGLSAVWMNESAVHHSATAAATLSIVTVGGSAFRSASSSETARGNGGGLVGAFASPRLPVARSSAAVASLPSLILKTAPGTRASGATAGPSTAPSFVTIVPAIRGAWALTLLAASTRSSPALLVPAAALITVVARRMTSAAIA